MKKISIIVPCYNEEKAIPLFYDELNKHLEKFPQDVSFELLFINDGSNSFNTLHRLSLWIYGQRNHYWALTTSQALCLIR